MYAYGDVREVHISRYTVDRYLEEESRILILYVVYERFKVSVLTYAAKRNIEFITASSTTSNSTSYFIQPLSNVTSS